MAEQALKIDLGRNDHEYSKDEGQQKAAGTFGEEGRGRASAHGECDSRAGDEKEQRQTPTVEKVHAFAEGW